MLGGVDQVGPPLPGHLLDERGPAQLFDEQGDVDGADVGAQGAGRLRAVDQLLRGGVAAGAEWRSWPP